MNKEELLKLGLTEEQTEKIISKTTELENQIVELQGRIKERDDQLKELGNSVKDNQELTEKINQLKEENKARSLEYENNLAKMRLDGAIDIALITSGAKNTKVVKALLDNDKIKLDGSTLIGLEEQLKGIKETDGYLFNSNEVKPSGLQPQEKNTTDTVKGGVSLTNAIATYYKN